MYTKLKSSQVNYFKCATEADPEFFFFKFKDRKQFRKRLKICFSA
jgi:hypothetical protein